MPSSGGSRQLPQYIPAESHQERTVRRSRRSFSRRSIPASSSASRSCRALRNSWSGFSPAAVAINCSHAWVSCSAGTAGSISPRARRIDSTESIDNIPAVSAVTSGACHGANDAANAAAAAAAAEAAAASGSDPSPASAAACSAAAWRAVAASVCAISVPNRTSLTASGRDTFASDWIIASGEMNPAFCANPALPCSSVERCAISPATNAAYRSAHRRRAVIVSCAASRPAGVRAPKSEAPSPSAATSVADVRSIWERSSIPPILPHPYINTKHLDTMGIRTSPQAAPEEEQIPAINAAPDS